MVDHIFYYICKSAALMQHRVSFCSEEKEVVKNTFCIQYIVQQLRIPTTYVVVIMEDHGEQRAISVRSCSDYSKNKPHGRL